MVTALAAAGLRLEHLHEMPCSPCDCFDYPREVEPGKAMIPGLDGKVPMLFPIKASAASP